MVDFQLDTAVAIAICVCIVDSWSRYLHVLIIIETDNVTIHQNKNDSIESTLLCIKHNALNFDCLKPPQTNNNYYFCASISSERLPSVNEYIYIYGLLPYADFLFLLLIIIIIWAVTAERQGNRCDSRRCHWSVFSNSMPRVRLKEWHTTVIEIISIWTPIGTVQWSSKNFIHFFHILCFI